MPSEGRRADLRRAIDQGEATGDTFRRAGMGIMRVEAADFPCRAGEPVRIWLEGALTGDDRVRLAVMYDMESQSTAATPNISERPHENPSVNQHGDRSCARHLRRRWNRTGGHLAAER